jgi:hypothetical protein
MAPMSENGLLFAINLYVLYNTTLVEKAEC